MTTALAQRTGFWKTVRLLLGTARKRSEGPRKRQQQMLRQRSGDNATDWGSLALLFAVLLMALINIGAAFFVRSAVKTGQRVAAEHQGKIVVDPWFLQLAYNYTVVSKYKYPSDVTERYSPNYALEAKLIANEYGGSQPAIEQRLRNAVREHGSQDFIAADKASPGLAALAKTGRMPPMLGSLVLILWGLMLAFQGEGLELDLQRRRHPMWEWLLSHPVPPGAVFLAEMLSPIAANPIFWCAPLFAAFLYGSVYGASLGLLALLLIGVPITVAAACLGKALEIGIVLRFPPRSRGAIIGLMSWLGYASMMLFLVGMFAAPRIVTVAGSLLNVFTVLPWPWLGLFLGSQSDGSFSFAAGMIACWIFAALLIAAGVWFSVWGTNKGLTGSFAAADQAPSAHRTTGTRFGKEPLYRKEFLWFIRDRSAIVQAILIPFTVAGYQVFNLRGLISHAQGSWNYLCGASILFGTYFLWILGPKSLASEGNALWIALTWPRGLESLLKAKAWLWSLISTGLVALVLGYAGFLYPRDLWKILLAGIGWFFFSRSMAEKSVTLVTITSSSGEAEKIPWSRRSAAQLGMLTFCIGVLTQRWHIAIMGIVYSWITAAAMWQNFRARLPYLFDPWSEELPKPPTLMHAMIAISLLVEGGAIVTVILLLVTGPQNIAIAQAMSYGICAFIVSMGVIRFLGNRGVTLGDILHWQDANAQTSSEPGSHSGLRPSLPLSLVAGVTGGLLLSAFAHGYLALLRHLPATAEILHRSQEQMAKIPNLRISYAVMAVLFAPFAEEYLFRGLLFRALDREWGGWRAVLGSAAFFAIYHPPLAWPPVALVGIANALLFKKTGRLIPAIALHMVYNAVVLWN